MAVLYLQERQVIGVELLNEPMYLIQLLNVVQADPFLLAPVHGDLRFIFQEPAKQRGIGFTGFYDILNLPQHLFFFGQENEGFSLFPRHPRKPDFPSLQRVGNEPVFPVLDVETIRREGREGIRLGGVKWAERFSIQQENSVLANGHFRGGRRVGGGGDVALEKDAMNRTDTLSVRTDQVG